MPIGIVVAVVVLNVRTVVIAFVSASLHIGFAASRLFVTGESNPCAQNSLRESYSLFFLFVRKIKLHTMKLVTVTLLAMAMGCVQAESAMSKMSQVMSQKASFHKQKQEAGVFAEKNYKSMGNVKCENGEAGEYSCKNVDIIGSITHEAMGSTSREGNDIWGRSR